MSQESEMGTVTFSFEKLEYRLLIFEKVLFKIPFKVGEWLFKHGLAIQHFLGVTLDE